MTAAISFPNVGTATPSSTRSLRKSACRSCALKPSGAIPSPNFALSSPTPICLFRLNLKEHRCENGRPRRPGRRRDCGLCPGAGRRPDEVRGAWARLGDRARDRAQHFWPSPLVTAIAESRGTVEEDGRADLQQRIRNGKGPPERALIDAPAEHRERWIATILSCHFGRRECANSGRPGPRACASNSTQAALRAKALGCLLFAEYGDAERSLFRPGKRARWPKFANSLRSAQPTSFVSAGSRVLQLSPFRGLTALVGLSGWRGGCGAPATARSAVPRPHLAAEQPVDGNGVDRDHGQHK